MRVIRPALGVGADLPVVRLVEQVDVERMVVCLGPGRRAGTLPLEPYVLEATDPDGERLLDAWAAVWSLPDAQPPGWRTRRRLSGDRRVVSRLGDHGRRSDDAPRTPVRALPAAADAPSSPSTDIAQAARPAP